MSSPLVSIITPNYNCAPFIAETIRSVQAQTYTNWELIIQDDCSTDDSLAIARKFAEADKRIIVSKNPTNSGAAITRNNALRQAKGKYIAFLDSDDLWTPTKLQEQTDFMSANGYAFTYHAYEEIDEKGSRLGVHVGGKDHVGVVGMHVCCWPGCLAVMYDAEKVGLVQINDVRKNNDTALWLKVVRKAECRFLDKSLALYRRRQGSITPPSISKRIMWHYRLFRDAERRSPLVSAILMCLNVFGNSYKKIFYVKKT